MDIKTSELAAINLIGLLAFVLGPLYFVSSCIAYAMNDKKNLFLIIKPIILLVIAEYVFTSLLIVKGMDLIYSLVMAIGFALICSGAGYLATKLVYVSFFSKK